MTVRFSDPYQALSWDGMHAHDHGLGGKHLWPALQNYIKQYGRAGPATVDAQFVLLVEIPFPADIPLLYRARSFPTWRRLYHFDKMMNISFSDATKLKDLVKVSI
jgi:hypothetical protein